MKKGRKFLLGVISALQSVSQKAMGAEYEMTVWSIVYNQCEKSADYYFRENYEDSLHFDVMKAVD